MSDNPYGPDPAEWRPEYDEWVAKYLRPSVAGTPVVTTSTPALPEPSWIKQAALEGQNQAFELAGFKVIGDPSMQPGDIAVWRLGASGYGHVEVVPDRRMHYSLKRGYGKRSFLARLADSVRGRK